MNNCVNCNSLNVKREREVLCLNTSKWAKGSDGTDISTIIESFTKWKLNLCDNCMVDNLLDYLKKDFKSSFNLSLYLSITCIASFFFWFFLRFSFLKYLFMLICAITLIAFVSFIIKGIISFIEWDDIKKSRNINLETESKFIDKIFVNQGELLIGKILLNEINNFELPKEIQKEKYPIFSDIKNLKESNQFEIIDTGKSGFSYIKDYLSKVDMWHIYHTDKTFTILKINLNTDKIFANSAYYTCKDLILFFKNKITGNDISEWADNELKKIEIAQNELNNK